MIMGFGGFFCSGCGGCGVAFMVGNAAFWFVFSGCLARLCSCGGLGFFSFLFFFSMERLLSGARFMYVDFLERSGLRTRVSARYIEHGICVPSA